MARFWLVNLFIIGIIGILLSGQFPKSVAIKGIKSCIGTVKQGEWCAKEFEAVLASPVQFDRFNATCPQYREAINREGLCCDKATFETYEKVYERISELGAGTSPGCNYNIQLLLCGLYCAPGQKPHWQVLSTADSPICGTRLSKLRLYIKGCFAKAWYKGCKNAKTSSGENFMENLCKDAEGECDTSTPKGALEALFSNVARVTPFESELFIADKFGNIGYNDHHMYALYPNQLAYAKGDKIPTDLYEHSLRVKLVQMALKVYKWFQSHFGH